MPRTAAKKMRAVDVTAELAPAPKVLAPVVDAEDARVHVGIAVDAAGCRRTIITSSRPLPAVRRLTTASDLGGGTHLLAVEIGEGTLADLREAHGPLCPACLNTRKCVVLDRLARRLLPRGLRVHHAYWRPGEAGSPLPGEPGSIECPHRVASREPEPEAYKVEWDVPTVVGSVTLRQDPWPSPPNDRADPVRLEQWPQPSTRMQFAGLALQVFPVGRVKSGPYYLESLVSVGGRFVLRASVPGGPVEVFASASLWRLRRWFEHQEKPWRREASALLDELADRLAVRE